MTAIGVYESHHVKCPACGTRATGPGQPCLCGGQPVAVVWDERASSPESVMVAATDNAGIGRRWLR